jgi:septal ring factor EnvC (AmiA/AmiB activator)
VNPFDALLLPPALVKRALDDLHDIARIARRYAAMEREILTRVELLEGQLAGIHAAVAPLAGQIGHMEDQLTGLAKEMAPIQNLTPIRRGIEPLERSMVAVRQSVDELEPMISDLDRKIREIDPKLGEMQDSIEPIGDLAEKIPGNRRRRTG